MRKTIAVLFATILFFLPAISQDYLFELYRRKADTSGFEFKNASALFKENGKAYQHVIASHTSSKDGTAKFYLGKQEILSTSIKKGNNRILLTVPAVSRPQKISIRASLHDAPAKVYSFTIVPPKKWHIYFVQHTHTDIGFTHPQSEVLAEQMRNIDYALDYCDQTDHLPDDAKFRWTCESAWVTREYLKSRPASQIERFKKRIAEGRVEVTGLSFNMAEISDENIMYDFLQPLKEFKRFGIPVKTAMQDDVNGIAWCIPDYLKNTGIRYLSMGVNETRSILPFDKPTPFWWEAPSGERLLAFRSEHYMTGNFFKIENDSPQFPESMLWYLADLEKKNYPFDRIAIQFSGHFTDNSPPSIASSELVKRWNAKYEFPKLKMSVVSEFLEYVEKNHGNSLPVYRNAWLDWWTDGFASTSRETAEIRKVQNLKQSGEGLFAMLAFLGKKFGTTTERKMDHISENALFFAEHTVGADESIQHPNSENTAKQWLQKGAYAWEAVKQLTLLNEEALAGLQEHLPKGKSPLIYIINPMGWKRSGIAEIFVEYEVLPGEGKASVVDVSTGTVIPVQVIRRRREGAYWSFEVQDIPAMGVKAFRIDTTTRRNPQNSTLADSNILENRFYKIIVDKATGSVSSFFDKELGLELTGGSEWKLGQLIRETLPNRSKLEPVHSSVSRVQVLKGVDGDVWRSIRIAADMTGYEKGNEIPRGIEMELRLYNNSKKVELKFIARKEVVTTPEGLYVAFPFSLPDSRIVFETIGGSLTQGQQLPGSSSDWNVAQNFVAVRGKNAQIIVAANETPLWQFSGLNIGKFERNPVAGKTILFSWVMNNYWFTNFRAAQEGAFSWGYTITSSRDTSNTYASRYSWSERNPLFSRVVLPGEASSTSNFSETVKVDGSSNALLVNSRPSFTTEGRVLFHFRELEGRTAEVRLTSMVNGRPIKKLIEVNVLGEETGAPLESVVLKPYEVRFIEAEF